MSKCSDKQKTIYYRKLLAANVKRLRLNKHLGQKELAEISDVGLATISNIERALYNPDLTILLSIADALGVSYVDLFSSAGEL